MVWARVAEAHMNVFAVARRDHRIARTAGTATARMLGGEGVPPDLRTDHLLVMCDDTGLFQHAIHDLPDRSHGYCVDDNARALLLSCALGTGGEVPLPETLTARFAAFLQHAWNPDVGRFRNFMGFDRRWLDDAGSEDSHGRALWALGICARDDRSPSRWRCRPPSRSGRRGRRRSCCWASTAIVPPFRATRRHGGRGTNWPTPCRAA
jgi:hypothetical protein